MLTNSIGSVGSSLEIIGSAYETSGSASDFAAAARPLLARGTGAVAVVEADEGRFVVRTAAGTGVKANDVLDGPQAALVKRAGAADGPVSTVITGSSPNDRRLAFAHALDGGLVMYQQTPLGQPRPVRSTPNSPFNELQGVVYVGSAPAADQLLFTTTASLPMRGSVDRRTISIGADKWLLFTASRQRLVGSLTRAVPWIVLGLGLFGSLIVSAVIALLLRRRAYALALVDARTADLQKTFVEFLRVVDELLPAAAAAAPNLSA